MNQDDSNAEQGDGILHVPTELELEQERHLSILELLKAAPSPSSASGANSAPAFESFFDDTGVGQRSPIKWGELSATAAAATLDELAEWLEWFLPTWRFDTLHFVFGCWWQHQYLVEEFTAIWLAWLTNFDPIGGAPTDPLHFNERVQGPRKRLEDNYRGHCKDGHHEDIPTPPLSRP